jgi:biotin carboxyl carrier protein
MTYDVKIGADSSKLVVNKDAFVYTREDGASVAKSFSIEWAGDGTYSVLIEGRSYVATLASKGEIQATGGEIIVNGRALNIEVQDPRKLRARGSAESGGGRQTIAAPMPGRVIRVLVEAGQEVEAGQGLIVVEAMKMQNEMKSPKTGKVLEIRTSAGAAVSAGDALLVIE